MGSGAVGYKDGFWRIFADGHVLEMVMGDLVLSRSLPVPNAKTVGFQNKDYGIYYINEDNGYFQRDFGEIVIPESVGDKIFAGMFDKEKVIQDVNLLREEVDLSRPMYGICRLGTGLNFTTVIVNAAGNPGEGLTWGNTLKVDNGLADHGCSGAIMFQVIGETPFMIGSLDAAYLTNSGSVVDAALLNNFIVTPLSSLNELGGIDYFHQKAIDNWQSKQ